MEAEGSFPKERKASFSVIPRSEATWESVPLFDRSNTRAERGREAQQRHAGHISLLLSQKNPASKFRRTLRNKNAGGEAQQRLAGRISLLLSQKNPASKVRRTLRYEKACKVQKTVIHSLLHGLKRCGGEKEGVFHPEFSACPADKPRKTKNENARKKEVPARGTPREDPSPAESGSAGKGKGSSLWSCFAERCSRQNRALPLQGATRAVRLFWRRRPNQGGTTELMPSSLVRGRGFFLFPKNTIEREKKHERTD